MKKLIFILMFVSLSVNAQEIMIEGGSHLSSGSGVGGFVRYTSDIKCPWDGRMGLAAGAWDGRFRNNVYSINCNWVMDEKFDLVFGGALRKRDIPEDVNNDLNFEFGIRFRLKELEKGGLYAFLYHYSNGEVLGIGSDNHEDNMAGVGYSISW